MNIGIFVPVYNNEQTLAQVLNTIPRSVGNTYTFVIVDDGSTDDSAIIARKYTRHVVMSGENRGVGTTTKIGLQKLAGLGHYDCVIKFDGDGQHNPRFIPKVIDSLTSHADLVICSRFHPESEQLSTPVDRLMLNKYFARVLSEITGWEIHDARSGFMGFKGKWLKPIAESLSVKQYGIPMDIILSLWSHTPEATVTSLPHPAIYGGPSITMEHRRRYEKSGETPAQRAKRFHDAYIALQEVSAKLNINIGPYIKQAATVLQSISA